MGDVALRVLVKLSEFEDRLNAVISRQDDIEKRLAAIERERADAETLRIRRTIAEPLDRVRLPTRTYS
jgi:hypothetical protein